MIESVPTPLLLQASETCARKGYFARHWEPNKLLPNQLVSEAVRTAILAPSPLSASAWGELAGDAVMQLCEDRGLASDTSRLYDSALNHAALADILVSAIRKPDDPAWLTPPNVQGWMSHCYMDPKGDSLRRIVLVSHWTDERHYSECRSWFSLGEIAHYELPMQMVVLVVGQTRDGLKRGTWSQGFLHPQNHGLRFRRRKGGYRSEGNTFNEKWEKIFREDHAEISRETWLESMLRDDVLPEVCFRVDIPVPPVDHLKRIRTMAERKLDRIYSMAKKPEANLSTCDWPVSCPFKRLCHELPEMEPSERNGFVRIQTSPAGTEPRSLDPQHSLPTSA